MFCASCEQNEQLTKNWTHKAVHSCTAASLASCARVIPAHTQFQSNAVIRTCSSTPSVLICGDTRSCWAEEYPQITRLWHLLELLFVETAAVARLKCRMRSSNLLIASRLVTTLSHATKQPRPSINMSSSCASCKPPSSCLPKHCNQCNPMAAAASWRIEQNVGRALSRTQSMPTTSCSSRGSSDQPIYGHRSSLGLHC